MSLNDISRVLSEGRSMEVGYKISGKFEQDGKWSSLTEDFEGTIVGKKGLTRFRFIGTMEEKYDSERDNKRYVLGVKKRNTLAYFKVEDEREIVPLIYFFRDYRKEGVWGVYLITTIFGPPRFIECGKASVTLETLNNRGDYAEVIHNYQSRNQQGCWGISGKMENYINFLNGMIKHYKY